MPLFAPQAGLCATPAELGGGKARRFPSASGTPGSLGFQVDSACRAPPVSWTSGCMPKHKHGALCPSPWTTTRLAPQARPCRSGYSEWLSGRRPARMHLKRHAHARTFAVGADTGARMHTPRVTTASGASTCHMCKHVRCSLDDFHATESTGRQGWARHQSRRPHRTGATSVQASQLADAANIRACQDSRQACAPAPLPSLASMRGHSLRSKIFMRTDTCDESASTLADKNDRRGEGWHRSLGPGPTQQGNPRKSQGVSLRPHQGRQARARRCFRW